MKNILYYCPTFYPENSGYANAFLGLLNAIKDNYKLTLITSKELNTKEIEIKNVSIKRFETIFKNMGLLYSLFVQFKMARYVNKNIDLFDKLFVETFEDVFFLFFLSKKASKKTIIRVHSTAETEYNFYFKRFYYRLSKFLINKSIKKKITNIASTNNYHIKFVKEVFYKSNLYEISKRNFFVVPNCLESSNYDGANDVNEHLKVQTDVSPKLFITLGRLDFDGAMQKGQGDLINAIIRLKSDFLKTRSQFKLVGNGAYFSLVKEIIEKENLDFVELIPRLNHEETLNLLKSSDFSILPSRFEGLSMFALESIGSGNAVIFSETGGLIDLFNKNGFLHPPQDIEQLANCIKKAIYLENHDLNVMKRNSHTLFTKNFSSATISRKFDQAINNIDIIK